MGCPDGCTGYELANDLDFDTNLNGVADSGDDYWNGGNGWIPIGGENSTATGTLLRLRNPFSAIFEGNGAYRQQPVYRHGHDRSDRIFRLFSDRHSEPRVDRCRREGEPNSPPGWPRSTPARFAASYVTGRVSADDNVGSLAGFNQTTGTIRGSYATRDVSGSDDVGGLVGGQPWRDRGQLRHGPRVGRFRRWRAGWQQQINWRDSRRLLHGPRVGRFRYRWIGRAGRGRDDRFQLLGYAHVGPRVGIIRPRQNDVPVAVAHELQRGLRELERGPSTATA